MIRKIILVVSLLAVAGCGASQRPGAPASPPRPQPVISGPNLSVPADTRTPLSQVPWCRDPQGRSDIYPCKWDAREQPVSGWDPQAPLVAIWVLRSPNGCTSVTRFIRISTNDDVAFSCYFAPGS